MNFRTAASKLRGSITVMTSTFELNNLQVLNIGCKPYKDDDGDLVVYVELSSIDGGTIPCDLSLKINLYDSEGNIYMINDYYISAESFTGYDTIEMDCFDSSHTLEIAVSGRLYVSRA